MGIQYYMSLLRRRYCIRRTEMTTVLPNDSVNAHIGRRVAAARRRVSFPPDEFRHGRV